MRSLSRFVVTALLCQAVIELAELRTVIAQTLNDKFPPETTRWVRTTPLEFDQIPAATRAISAELLDLEPRAAHDKLIEEWKRADSEIGTVQTERFSPPFGQYDQYARWRRVRGRGWTLAFGDSADVAKVTHWVDRQRCLAVVYWQAERSLPRAPVTVREKKVDRTSGSSQAGTSTRPFTAENSSAFAVAFSCLEHW
ncbi:MAG: hypothetical protein ACR2NM_02735 [Bythopirellula sp.]